MRAELYPIVDGPEGAGPMDEADLRQRLRLGRLSIETQIQYAPWTGDHFLPAAQISQLQCEVYSEPAEVSRRIQSSLFPVATSALLGILGLSFLGQSLFPDLAATLAYQCMLGWGPTVLDGRWYSPLTAQLFHGSLGHFLVNIAVIAYCAVHVERLLRPKMVVQVILLASAVGGILVCLGSDLPVIGSSIVGFGFWGAQVALGFRYAEAIPVSHQKHYGWMTFIVFAPIYAWGVDSLQVSHLGHLGGFLGGFFWGMQGIRKGTWRRWIIFTLLLILPSLVFGARFQDWEVFERPDLGLRFEHPSRMRLQSLPKLQLFSVHPVDTAYAFVGSWRVEVPPMSTQETVQAWWEHQLDHPHSQMTSRRLNNGVQRFELVLGEYRVVEHQIVRGLWILRFGYWMHLSATPRTAIFEQMLDGLEQDEPSALQTLSEQFELLSAVPDVRYDYAVELINWGEVRMADEVIEPLIFDEGPWGLRFAKLRLKLHAQYLKVFGLSGLSWIEPVLKQHGSKNVDIYTQAILYAVAHQDCGLAIEWLRGIDDVNHRAEIHNQLSVYCSIEEE